MTWLEKLRRTQDAARVIPELGIVFDIGAGMNALELAKVRQSFPFVDEQYLKCLGETGGLQIDMYHLFGSETDGFTPLADGWRRWLPVVKGGGIPIGEDPSGDCIVLCKDGEIRLMSIHIGSVDEGRVLAKSFAEFLSDVLMGPRFPTLFPLGYTPSHENEWTKFLRSQGWFGG